MEIIRRSLGNGKTFIDVNFGDEAAQANVHAKEQLCLDFLNEVVALYLAAEVNLFNLGYAYGFLQGRGYPSEQIPHFGQSQPENHHS